jgi:membrane protease YdiL (CAAX protease family)
MLTKKGDAAGLDTLGDLRPRERAGLVIAIVALAIALNPLNRQFRFWLRDEVVGGVPFWLDHIGFMLTLMLVVWGLVGLLVVGPRGVFLNGPDRPREAWLAGVLSGLGLIALVLVTLKTLGPVVFEPHPNWPVLFANFASNFYEEFIYRGVILGLLLKALNGQHRWLAALSSALLFSQGHLHYPPIFVAVVLAGGLTWAWLTLRYRSLWPAWVSHMVADTIIDNLFRT